MRNLLSNAVKYTTEGKLLLGCLRRGDMLRMEVWDTGPGIPELELPAVSFEEFHQLDNPARERSKGLGLGLAIVQRLADLLGHKIDVRSRLGAGSVFTIEVPLARPELAELPAPSQKEAQDTTTSRGTVLIVEDDPAVLEMLQLLFDAEDASAIGPPQMGKGARVGVVNGRPCRTWSSPTTTCRAVSTGLRPSQGCKGRLSTQFQPLS